MYALALKGKTSPDLLTVLSSSFTHKKIEGRKLADQETEFGSKTEQGSTHMRGICVEEHAYACCSYPNPRLSKLTTLRRGNSLDQIHAYA
ncbi:hypothetical protein PIB30_079961 [Stylosanthes scabra]|uniref:Uncharacterized protein n=1 Tax=Stylosanthes scabra TaxID=79078 RepID=A0ABU6ZQ12_9FABA|nr:hypothetical protein [Stylosanthes scabra]